MRLTKRWWLVVMSLVSAWGVCLLGVPLIAHADYTINHYNVHIDVQKNGNAKVTQAMTYEFDDDYHGVFNVQDLRGLKGAQVEQVTSRLNQGKSQIAQANQTGANNTYQLTKTSKQMRFKLYRQVSDGDQLQVTYRYRLNGVVTNYADTAELNWKIIGTGWDVALKNVKLTVQLPAKKITALQAWTHGPLAGQTQVNRQAGRVVMTVARNPANQFVESHLVFPTSVTATNSRTSSKKRLAAVRKQEAALAKAANQRRQRRQLIRRVIYGAAVGSLMMALIGIWWWLRRHPANRHQRPIPINHSFEVPAVTPAVAQSLWRTRRPDTRALAAEILQAAANRELTITTEPGRKQPIVVLTKLKPLTNSFLATCFEKVTASETLTLSQLKAFGEKDKQGRLNDWFDDWQWSVDQEVTDYQDMNNYALTRNWLGFGWLITVLSLVVTGTGWLISPKVSLMSGAVTGIVAVAFWILALTKYRQIAINTDEGLILVNQINGFRQMLKDIGHFNTAEIGDLVLWEAILPYATAFGLAETVAAKLQVDFGTEALASGLLIYYPLFYGDLGGLDLSGTLGDSLSGALSASSTASSPSGDSGGFSGGSSGGFGGGSGGGAF
ncbi:hypothetical protein MUDAN_DOGOELCO_02678 [Lactiplantibacillus mudanjiangensis]|uniref:DUF2207 domain-containing protein n=1 Tax=Lactiplantibacillus mudanjiangensis TaxID=1296538 RepID=UPI0010159003|nr:DUF2207 domain-containing protein [Lactiplantibacillus mudanjiangensis]VDG33512.1 hypothetical protein MUDAN_DOGOELCO_02678 [Lactiplantibacillus mudanjiangensis]